MTSIAINPEDINAPQLKDLSIVRNEQKELNITPVHKLDRPFKTATFGMGCFWVLSLYMAVLIKRQYMSLILYHDEEQKEIAEQSRAEEQIKRAPEVIRTEISPKTNFFPAEEYGWQSSKLRGIQKKQEELRNQYEKEQNLHENKAMLSKESKDKLSVNFMYEPPPGVRKDREKDDNEPEYKFEW
ncbi:hypothetical protein EVAR_65007_1 [Eumeta japonica]|uniref:peptide-methionine (S)-S-oxide reductase n=1 Tax=Eumeta variegata TaxID=151549 RepID=A0A4C1SNV1_EUMVA|nr:hypothetical protein EVAR_65007_1 [Eumeta japonica]